MPQTWRRQWVAELVFTRPPWTALTVHARSSGHCHPRRHIPIHIRSSPSCTARSHTWSWIQRCPVIHWTAHSISISTPRSSILPLHLKCRELSTLLTHSSSRHRRWALCSWKLGLRRWNSIIDRALLRHVLVVVLPAHLRILCDSLLARLSRHQSPAHGACDNAASDNEDGSRKHDPAAPCHVRDKEEYVDQEGEKCDE